MPSKFISNDVLREVLKQATDDERLSLTKILDSDRNAPYGYRKLQEEICDQGGHSVVNLFRGQGTGYLDIVDDVADELGIKNIPSYMNEVKYFDEIENLKFTKEEATKRGKEYALKVEEKIILKLLEMAYKQLDDTKKEEFDKQINKVAQKFDSNITKGLSGTAGLLALGNLGGFATYTFLTTSLSTISMGTLGFGAYTAATSLLSIVLGPVGWAGLGIAGIFALGKPSYQKLIPIVAIAGAIRQRIEYEKPKATKAYLIDISDENIKELFNAFKEKTIDTKKIKQLIEKSVQLDKPNKDGNTALILAIEHNCKEIVELLIEKNVDLNIQNNFGNTALMIAAFNNCKEIVKLLLEKSVQLDKPNKDGNTALILAIEHNCKEIVELLLEKNVDLNIQNNFANTALMIAAFNNYIEIVKLLLKKGVKLNIFNNDKKSALMIASEKNYIEIVKLLLETSSEANEKNENNHTALHVAAEKDCLEVVKILIKNNNKDIDIEDNIGLTPLSWSIYKANVDVAKYLFSKIEPDVDKKYKNDFTLLMWATIGGNEKIVNFLIEHKANVNLKNKDGMTALMWASMRGHYNIVKFLIENGADVNLTNKDGMTALMWASMRGHYNIVKFLIENGADREVESKDKKNALFYAKEEKHNNIIMLLSDNTDIYSYTVKENNKIKTISFNNFKAFGNKKQSFNKKPITLIYGANSVGKSSLIYLIAYLKTLHNSKDINTITTDKFGDKIDIGGVEKFIYQRDINNIIEIEMSIDIQEEDNIKICYKIDIKNLLLEIVYKNSNETLAIQTIKYDKEYEVKKNNTKYMDEKNKKLIDLINKKLEMQYIGPSRPALQRDYNYKNQISDDNQYNSENLWGLLTDDKDTLDKVNEKLKLLGMNYLVKTYIEYNLDDDFETIIGNLDDDSETKKNNFSIEKLKETKNKYRIVFEDVNNANIEISNLDLGFGVSQVLPILIATTKHKNMDIAMEQPELHLHPKLQMDLADEFIRSYKENNNEFIIETHSEHILLRIMKRMRHTAEDKPDRDKNLDLTPDDVCLLYVDSHKGQTLIRELELDKDGSLLSRWPNGFFEDSYNEMFS